MRIAPGHRSVRVIGTQRSSSGAETGHLLQGVDSDDDRAPWPLLVETLHIVAIAVAVIMTLSFLAYYLS
ncbi:MAG: hypothetical protein ACXVZ1_07215 [Gaiellaceae bacterium]